MSPPNWTADDGSYHGPSACKHNVFIDECGECSATKRSNKYMCCFREYKFIGRTSEEQWGDEELVTAASPSAAAEAYATENANFDDGKVVVRVSGHVETTGDGKVYDVELSWTATERK